MEAAFISEKTVSGFSVVQFRTEGADTLDYISVGKAAETGKVKITEIDEGGRVGTILVQNDSDDCIFIAEGDLLQGAKQNRVVIASVFVTPRSKFHLPVNCVEQGRWRHRSRGFTPHNQSAPTDLKRKMRNTVHNNIIMNRTHIADQMEHRVGCDAQAGRADARNIDLAAKGGEVTGDGIEAGDAVAAGRGEPDMRMGGEDCGHARFDVGNYLGGGAAAVVGLHLDPVPLVGVV